MGEIFFLVFLMAVCGLGFNESFSWRILKSDTSGGAAFWPRIILVALFVCCAIRLITVLMEKKDERKKFVFLDLFYGHRGAFLLSLVLYYIGIKYLGYLIATVVYLNIIVNVMYKFTTGSFGTAKNIIVRFVCLTAASFAVYYFFGQVLHIMVPAGIFGI
ncbi:MAG: tripartite tricarboxylate transporter TctB family protein [Clostridia bacterium]|nr:tripartite tricarboxylate transporter TctB family protein [Clostridia bacterium]